jgi:hypothetical protein
VAGTGLLHTLTNLAAVLVLVAKLGMRPIVLEIAMTREHRRALEVAFEITTFASLVAGEHSGEHGALLLGFVDSFLWMLAEFLVQPIHFECCALLTVCIFAGGHAFLHHRKVFACFDKSCQWLWTFGMA